MALLYERHSLKMALLYEKHSLEMALLYEKLLNRASTEKREALQSLSASVGE